MLEGRGVKDRKSLSQFEAKGNIDNRTKQQRNEGITRNPNSIVRLVKVNPATRIPKIIGTPTPAPPLVVSSSSSHHQPLSVPLSSTKSSSSLRSPCSTTTTATSELTPEIYFLIREHAKTLETISKITNHVDKLEHKIDNICRKVQQIDKYKNENKAGGNKVIKKGKPSSSGIAPNALSDDSGVEYSWTTNETGQDDDELSSLLNQITKFSDSIKQTLNENTSSTLRQPVDGNIDGAIRCHQQSKPLPLGPPPLPQPSATRKNVSPMHTSRLNDCPDSNSVTQSFSALLFEPNVEHFLANLDFVP